LDQRPQECGDLGDFLAADGDGDDELVDVVVPHVGDGDTVDLEEDGRGEPAEALVAIDERIGSSRSNGEGRQS